MSTFDIENLKTGMKVTVSEPFYNGCPEYIILFGTPAGDVAVNTEKGSCFFLKDIGLYGKIIKVEEPECVFLLKGIGPIKYNTIWERRPEQIKQQELQAKYDAAKKELEELGKALGVNG